DGRILYRNRNALTAMGLPEGVAQPGDHFGSLHPDWVLDLLRRQGFPTATQEGFWQGETALLDGQGGHLPVSQVLLAHYDETGALERLSSIMRHLGPGPSRGTADSGQGMYRQIVEAAREGFEHFRHEQLATSATPAKVPVDSGGDIDFLDLDRIRFFQAEGNYARAFTEQGHHLANRSLADLERRLPVSSFLRCHRSYLVNLGHVRSLKVLDGQTYLVMDTDQGDRVPVSRRSLDTVRAALGLT
ncbi:MAG TPA: LytTR family DNA-binding domain-containing protein, partial [Gammaproteobacteria bacterium]|nr:LytTR family DNA-binding domain-containing protein [Gammaproteobacteria bacterium]